MTIDAIIGKFLDDETLVDGGRIAVRDVVEELSGEGVTVHAMTVANVQMISRHVLAIQRERVARDHSRTTCGIELNCIGIVRIIT
jgi:hypothetical protein